MPCLRVPPKDTTSLKIPGSGNFFLKQCSSATLKSLATHSSWQEHRASSRCALSLKARSKSTSPFGNSKKGLTASETSIALQLDMAVLAFARQWICGIREHVPPFIHGAKFTQASLMGTFQQNLLLHRPSSGESRENKHTNHSPTDPLYTWNPSTFGSHYNLGLKLQMRGSVYYICYDTE